jgi:hypothetical protein
MHKRKAGLQKEVSKIFTGIQVPRKDAPEADTRPAAPVPAPHIEPKQVLAPPRPYTLPEAEIPPAQLKKSPVPAKKVYEPPAPQPTDYKPPAPMPAPTRRHKPEMPPKSSVQIPGLKIWEKLKVKLLIPKPGVSPGRQKAMVVMMPVLFVVFIVVLAVVLRTPKRPSSNAANNIAALGSTAFDGKIDWELPPPYPENLRDAMVFGATPQTSEENSDRPVVKGIVYSEDNPCAVVGDRIVSEGEVVQGATVVKINPDSVEFAKGDESWTQKVER